MSKIISSLAREWGYLRHRNYQIPDRIDSSFFKMDFARDADGKLYAANEDLDQTLHGPMEVFPRVLTRLRAVSDGNTWRAHLFLVGMLSDIPLKDIGSPAIDGHLKPENRYTEYEVLRLLLAFEHGMANNYNLENGCPSISLDHLIKKPDAHDNHILKVIWDIEHTRGLSWLFPRVVGPSVAAHILQT